MITEFLTRMISKLIKTGRLALVGSVACFLISSPPARAADDTELDREGCRKNLTALYNAIQAHRADNKDLPSWLSDLVPKYIKDPNVLTCPATRKTGNVNNLGTEDPKVSTTYLYQFSDGPIPKVVPGGEGHTMKEWKRRQMALVGSKVPMIRCHNHGRVLNISFDGRIYDSEGSWEGALKNEIDTAELFPNRIFASEAASAAAARAKASIPSRGTNTPPNLIDLSKHYNASLAESWHPPGPGGAPANNLEWLPQGLQKFGDVQFDVRGLIQLSSKKMNAPRFPLAAKNIVVEQKAKTLHFLHSTGWSAADGTPVCTYVMHFGNGKSQNFTVLYGTHVVDWVNSAEPQDPNTSMVAWSGRSPANNSQTLLHVYKSQWTNPTPDETITSIDFLSANLDPAPFLIAITAESP